MEPSAHDFLEACGSSAPLHFAVEQRGRVIERRTLTMPFALLGRDERADFHFADKRISHRHAYLQMSAGQLWCVDLDSRTGTHWEDGRQFAGPLSPGQGVRLGPYTVRLLGQPSSSASALPSPLTIESDNAAVLPRIALDFGGKTMRQRTWMVDRPLTLIGRAAFCKVRLHSSMVSRVHCALLNTAAGLWVIDLLGRDGTYVNGTAVRWAKLSNDDELQVDQFHIDVRFLAPPHNALPAPLTYQPETAANHFIQCQSPPRDLAPSHYSRLTNGLLPPPATNGHLPAVAAPALPSANAEALLLPLVSQFSQIQQQMFDQFQQSLVLMSQMFGGLQREQMQMLRQEMDELREITRELQEVQAEWSKQSVAAPSANGTLTPPVPSLHRELPLPAHLPAPSAAPTAPVPASSNVHLWLAERMEKLQHERQTRWQRVLSLVSGH